MIKVILSKRSTHRTSPILIRFGVDDSKEIGTSCDLAFSTRQTMTQLSILSVSYRQVFSHQFQFPFTESHNFSTMNTLLWSSALLHTHCETLISWLNGRYIESEHLLTWLRYPLDVIETTQHWRLSTSIERAITVRYGPTDRAYICYRHTHPYRGKVLVSFKKQATTNISPIKLELKNIAQVCYWGLPGGLIRSDDDIPPIDRKIPIEPQLQRAYIMQPTITCERVDNAQQILLSQFSYTSTRGQFSATGNIKFCSRIDMERAIGHELKLTINGYEFIVMCEQAATSSKFANSSYSANIRSRFALLSAPYARATNYTNSVDKTAAGIMSDILENSGWTLDNQMIDYPVPKGAFSYRGLTPATALLKVANSIGAILDIDDTNKKVSVVPEWPVNPWSAEQATPDVILNESLILEHNTRDTIQPEYNAVFVRGEQQGVACKIKRSGTAGDMYARDIVDSLITDNQAARQRGTCELARSGNKQESTIRTKLLSTLPPIRPSMLVGINYSDSLYKATCDSTTLSASINNQGAITVNQTIKVISNV
ncbi:hypothetical protein [Pseudoalteromonas byunsanensis]|uniref:Uncharacterized protein n=1 Tax=Pseudoalteromonas byunsanensis TaxID=327939 RepID=A0A1S1NBM8_9GAMM|nr:hypothetical protein [Pseudoalteromonas byunsanensis]OHU97138.1 hypothetical protein BIW53_02120 [Pseudoalteromonas byunsanensis]